jgi:hypothetical protein
MPTDHRVIIVLIVMACALAVHSFTQFFYLDAPMQAKLLLGIYFMLAAVFCCLLAQLVRR